MKNKQTKRCGLVDVVAFGMVAIVARITEISSYVGYSTNKNVNRIRGMENGHKSRRSYSCFWSSIVYRDGKNCSERSCEGA